MTGPYTATASVSINCGHRVPGSRCSGIHGHSVTVTVSCLVPPPNGKPDPWCLRSINDVLRSEITVPCDGGMLLWTEDPLTSVLRPHVLMGISLLSVDEQGWWEGCGEFGKLYLLPCPPTAENLAKHWFERMAEPVRHCSGQRAKLVGVKVSMSSDIEAEFGPVFESKPTAS